MNKAPVPSPLACKGCKYNFAGACKKHPARKMNPVNGYVTYYSCDIINKDGKCKDYQEEDNTMRVICGILLLVVVIICVVCSSID